MELWDKAVGSHLEPRPGGFGKGSWTQERRPGIEERGRCLGRHPRSSPRSWWGKYLPSNNGRC